LICIIRVLNRTSPLEKLYTFLNSYCRVVILGAWHTWQGEFQQLTNGMNGTKLYLQNFFRFRVDCTDCFPVWMSALVALAILLKSQIEKMWHPWLSLLQCALLEVLESWDWPKPQITLAQTEKLIPCCSWERILINLTTLWPHHDNRWQVDINQTPVESILFHNTIPYEWQQEMTLKDIVMSSW
jgi:hypothetical protein